MLGDKYKSNQEKKVRSIARAKNSTLNNPVSEAVIESYVAQRVKALENSFDRAHAKCLSDVSEAQLILAKQKLNAATNGNKEARRIAKVEANRLARQKASEERKAKRVAARKAAALERKKRDTLKKSG